MEELQNVIKQFRKRIRIAYAWYGASIGAALGALACVFWSVFDYFSVLYAEWFGFAIVILGMAFVGAAVGWFLKVSDAKVGDSIDRRAELKNRVGTAIILGANAEDFSDAQRWDAALRAKKLHPKKLFPLRYYRWHTAMFVLCLVASTIFILGNTPFFLSAQDQAEREELKKAAKAIERVAKPIIEEDQTSTEEEKDLAKELQKLAREMKKGRLNKEKALEEANDLLQQAEKLAEKNRAKADSTLGKADTALDKLMREKMDEKGLTGADPNMATKTPNELNQMAQDAQKKIDDLQKKLSDDKPKSDAEMKKLQEQLQQAKDDLQKIELSKQAQETFSKMMQMKEWQELQEMARKLAQNQKGQQGGKNGQQKLTKEQLEEMQKKLEELAKQLKDEKAMKEYIRKLMEAMKKKQGG